MIWLIIYLMGLFIIIGPILYLTYYKYNLDIGNVIAFTSFGSLFWPIALAIFLGYHVSKYLDEKEIFS